ncbi:hypothetical protein MTR67_015710 [Solanum verrucosum]|uniref:Nitrate transporter n=1 Tax=Solanum verrucosum TaxID=315347 RepID=A0AAF0QHB6_SOLVR|nr:hypothetical protein MTR67_015710 [Solanum verrucosum]
MEDSEKQTSSRSSPIPIKTNEALENVASYGVLPNMTNYLMREYRMGFTTTQNLLFFWSAATNFLPIVGAVVADSYLGRFPLLALVPSSVSWVGSGLSFGFRSQLRPLSLGRDNFNNWLILVGHGRINHNAWTRGSAVLWLTAMIPKVRPPPCNQTGQACKSTTGPQYMLLVFSFLLLSIGTGGISPCSLAFGANQFDKGDNNNPNKQTVLESFFSWFWSFIRVIVVAFKNRRLHYPNQNSDYHHKNGSGPQVPTDKLRFLNKACIIKSPEDVKPNGVAANPWNLCTVEQVEELKALIRVVPLWSTGIMISINLSQSSFPLLQAQSMNRHLTKGFQIPAGSFGMFLMIALTIWVLLYDRVMLPLASKIKGRPVRLKPIVRMGLGIFVSCTSMVVSGIIEHIRRKRAISEGLLNNSQGLVEMSAIWLIN